MKVKVEGDVVTTTVDVWKLLRGCMRYVRQARPLWLEALAMGVAARGWRGGC